MAYTAPTRPLYGEPWRTCPVTGLTFPRSKGVWRNGRWVHPLAADEPGYKEPIDNSPPAPDTTANDFGKPVEPQ